MGGGVGLFIAKNSLKWENNTIIHSGNIGSQSVASATNADKVDGYHEGSFFRYRGNIDVNYVDLTTYTSNATNYQNPSNGVWNVNRSGYSAGLITFTGSGSASGLDIYFHYAKGADFKFRRRIDSNRLSGNWETFITSENIGSQSVSYATSAGSATTASQVKDAGNGTAITFKYSTGGFTSNPTWLGAWNGYQLTYVSPSVLSVNYASSAGSVAWGNVTSKPSQYLWFSKAIDARGLNENTWYPVTFNASGSIHYGTIHVMVNRKLEGKNASWCTHSSGFSVGLWFEMCASGWGTYPWYYYVHHFNYSFCDQPPLAGITQDSMTSTGIIYVRGGEYYNFFCSDNDVTFTLRTSKYYTINSSPYIYSVEPLSSRPTDITVDRVSKYYVDSAVSSAASSGYVTINYNNDSNSTYQMLWGSGNSVYGTGGIYCNPYTDYLYSGSFYCGNWFRSSGATGWYNESYGGGIYMEDSTYVRTYNGKQFYVSSESQHAIYTAGGFASAHYGCVLSTYYNGTWYGDTIYSHGNGNLSIDAPGGNLYLAYFRGNTYFCGGSYYINRSGYFNGSCSYATSAGSATSATSASSATNATNLMPENTAHYFRDPNSASWRGGMIWGSGGSESMSFVVANSGTRFQFVVGSDIASWNNATWQSASPDLAIYGGCIYVKTAAYITSDARKKYDIRDIYNTDIDKLFETDNAFIHHFKWKESDVDSFGFIAQELQDYCPEAVNFDKDADYYSVNYNVAFAKIIGAMYKRMKQLENENNNLKSKIEDLYKLIVK